MPTENNPALGESEHDKEMIALAERGQQQEEVIEEGSGEEETSDRPEWLPEKFKSPEDMAKAYGELEKKLGAKPEDKDSEDQGSEDQGSEDKASDDDNDQGDKPALDFERYAEEVSTNGELSEEAYAELEKAGIPREVVDTYVEAQQAKTSAVVSRFEETAGGKEQMQAVLEWAQDGADKAMAAAYNYAIEAQDFDSAHGIFEKLVESHKTATGYEGKSVSGVQTSNTGDVFESQRQVTEAMSDPRYSGPKADPAYIKEVERKLMRSKNLL